MSNIDFSLVLACYNEGPTFEEYAEKILEQLKKLRLSWEVIFVEDKSLDDTKLSVQKFTDNIKNSKALFHKKNEGRGKSVADGIFMAKGKICGFMDVDCEISPSYIPVFISEIKKGYDMAIANRFYEGRLKSVLRFIASRTYSKIVGLILTLPFEDTEAGFKFFDREKIMPVLRQTQDKRWFWDTEICARAHLGDLSVSQVPVLFKKRADKKSTVRLVPDSIEYLKKVVEFKRQMNKEHN